MMIVTRFVLAVALLLGVGLGGACSREAKPRAVKLALVARQAGPEVLGLLDLAQAELAREDRLQLLERQRVDRVLREQHLSLSGLVDASTAVKVGELLAADLFGVLETTEAGKEAVGLVVYDAGTGVKLVDRALPAGAGQAQVAAVVDALRAAGERRERGWEGLKLV